MSVSVPFLTVSMHVGVRHVTLQTPLTQSAATRHVLLATHLGHTVPPQSTSVSAPFLCVSAQVAVVQVLVVGEQKLVLQSAATAHPWPDPQFVEHVPPQSRSVSTPFLTPSVHVGAAQRLFTHDPVVQSLPVAQPRPCAHLFGQLPPQSGAVSVPFVAPSAHVGAWHMLLVQTFDAQSVPSAQPADTGHLVGHECPQSESLSSPF
jgi:hypothetical protein